MSKHSSKAINRTLAYYEQHAGAYAERTLKTDMSKACDAFLSQLPPVAKILDAGCGSGRDSRYFMDQGHEVTAFDGSAEMAREASRLLGMPVVNQRFDELEYKKQFDGVWACASLLHLPDAQLPEAMRRLTQALKEGGLLFASFKQGQGEGVDENGRYFNYEDEEPLTALVSDTPGLRLVDITKTVSALDGETQWVSVWGKYSR